MPGTALSFTPGVFSSMLEKNDPIVIIIIILYTFVMKSEVVDSWQNI